ncbi:hypothetical protein H1R20_g4857, partial [Candolleomyces eurysporus]
MPAAGVVSIVDSQFGGAYPAADEKGKPDTTSPPGCHISTTNPAAVRVITENRVESYVFQGDTVISREPGDETLHLEVFVPFNNPANSVEDGGNQAPPGFNYRAHYVKAGSEDTRTKAVSTDQEGFGCSVF